MRAAVYRTRPRSKTMHFLWDSVGPRSHSRLETYGVEPCALFSDDHLFRRGSPWTRVLGPLVKYCCHRLKRGLVSGSLIQGVNGRPNMSSSKKPRNNKGRQSRVPTSSGLPLPREQGPPQGDDMLLFSYGVPNSAVWISPLVLCLLGVHKRGM